MTVIDDLDRMQCLISAAREFAGLVDEALGTGGGRPLTSIAWQEDQGSQVIELSWESAAGDCRARTQLSLQRDMVWLLMEAWRSPGNGRREIFFLPQLEPWNGIIPGEFESVLRGIVTTLEGA